MRFALSLLVLVFTSAAAIAQTAQVSRIDITEYGLYTSTVADRVGAPNTATGVVSRITNVKLAATTRAIPAQQGVEFGFRFVVVGAPAGKIVPLHMVTVFPPPGLRNPATQQVKAQSEYDTNAVIGAISYKSYGFTNDWEVSLGLWTMQIWYEGRKLAQQQFNVVRR